MMLGGLNGFNANPNFDFTNAHRRNLKVLEEKEIANLTSNSASNLTYAQPNLTTSVDYNALDPDKLDQDQLKIWANKVNPRKLTGKKLSKWLGVKMGFEKAEGGWRKKFSLKLAEPVALRKVFSLSGYTADDKISVWGKINGLDPSIGKDEAAELKRFIDSTKVLRSNSFDKKDDVFSVDGFVDEFHIDLGGVGNSETKGIGLRMGLDMTELLDSDMDLENFKDKWLEFAAERILGEYANVKISLNGGSLKFDQTPQRRRETYFGQKMQKCVSYADEASKKEFLKFLKEAFKNGENIGDVLQNIALKEGAANEKVAQKDAVKEKKFKPIQATSKSQTYVYKDIRREFFEKFIETELEKGTDIMELLRKTGKISNLDVKA